MRRSVGTPTIRRNVWDGMCRKCRQMGTGFPRTALRGPPRRRCRRLLPLLLLLFLPRSFFYYLLLSSSGLLGFSSSGIFFFGVPVDLMWILVNMFVRSVCSRGCFVCVSRNFTVTQWSSIIDAGFDI